MTTTDNPHEPITTEPHVVDDDVDEPPTTEGTHPVAMVGLVSAIAGLITATCICVYPPLAPVLPSLCGLIALVLAGITTVKVKRGLWHESNRLQATWGLILGAVDLFLGLAWAILLYSQGAMLGLGGA